MKFGCVSILGILLLAFAVLAFFGNYVQWFGAESATATILAAEKQWVRKGSGHMNLEIEYEADGQTIRESISVSEKTLKDAQAGGGLEIFYKKSKPGDAVPVVVLTEKRRYVLVALIAGLVLTVGGFFLKFPRNQSKGAGIESTSQPNQNPDS